MISFDDDLKVERLTEVKDTDWGSETYETIYEGKGRYQQGGPVYSGILITNSVVFIPRDLFIKENDVVQVTIHNGRIKRGIVGTIRYIKMPLSGNRHTRFILKQVQDVD